MDARGINDIFISDLKCGKLRKIFGYVKAEADLSLEIRENYINIYYKGGNLLKISQKRDSYIFEFDTKYCINDDVKKRIKSWTRAEDFTEANLDILKTQIDHWMAKDVAERKFQHEILLNCKSIVDIEYQVGAGKGSYRIDMVLVNNGHIVLVENKYGVGAISSRSTKPNTIKPGIRKHYIDFIDLATTPDKRKRLIESVNNILQNKYNLGIGSDVKHFEDDVVIDFLFVIYDYNNNSRTFMNEIDDIKDQFKEGINSYDTRVQFIEMGEEIIVDFDKTFSIYDYEYNGNR